MTIIQSLIIRNPSLTKEEASDSLYRDHGPLVVPYFLSHGLTYYAQVHPVLTTKDPELKLKLEKYDLIGEEHMEELQKFFNPETPEPQWKKDYYMEVILKDEKRLLVSPAMEHVLQVPAGTVEGDRRVIIENGQVKIDVPDAVWKVWREYEARGEELEKRNVQDQE